MKYEHPWVSLEMTLEGLNLTQKKFAELIWKSPAEVNHIIAGRRSITADWAFRISAVCGGEPRIWLALQAKYDEQKFQKSDKYPQFLQIRKKAKQLLCS